MKEEIKKILIENKEAYLYDFISQVEVIENNNIPTCCINVNGNIYFNKKFYNGLTASNLIFILYHELMHLIYEHHCTKKTNHYLVNVAGDIFINEELLSIGYIPTKGSLIKRVYNIPDYIYTAEEIYQWLDKNLPDEEKNKLQIQNEEEIANDELINEEEIVNDELQKILSKIKSNIQKKKKVDIQVASPVKWDIDLRGEIGRLIKRVNEKNYRRPARYEPKGIIRPNYNTTILQPKINIYIDKSGSMKEDLPIMIASIKEIKSKLKDYIPTYYAFDTETIKIEENELDKICADGGTIFNSIIGNADLHIIITDGALEMDYINSIKNIILYKIHNNTITREK